ncbi:hypothetical protein L1987_29461 [Smallanthus sonchifolius]|uniref:Uncharacterized protein n=1 Tax=Smallanthus sonchifolius TaxID=185202 RepID=A0ACB9I2Q6_9ASTR|nr:hypothetical protein L1987_29461 [Smallanthus sonchifolius]
MKIKNNKATKVHNSFSCTSPLSVLSVPPPTPFTGVLAGEPSTSGKQSSPISGDHELKLALNVLQLDLTYSSWLVTS